MKHWLIKLLLRSMTDADRDLCTRLLLDKVDGLPLADIIYQDDRGVLYVNGRQIDSEKARQLRTAAEQALNNPALLLIREQVAYQASILGAVKAQSIPDLTFARAALWWGREEDTKLHLLAQTEKEPTL